MYYSSEVISNYLDKKIRRRIARGVIVIDKEAGVTSHDEVNRLRKILWTKKIGHSGTLDPKVTGILVCGLGQGTRVLEYVLLSQKVYDCEIIFHKSVERVDFEKVLQKFRGKITQLPPVKSSVVRVERQREVYDLDLLSFAHDGRSARMRCAVERGTYIRKLCHDMGLELSTTSQSIAHMGELRRIQAGPFSFDNVRTITDNELDRLKKCSRATFLGWWYKLELLKYLYPIERVLVGVPSVYVYFDIPKFLRTGGDLFVPGVAWASAGVKPGDLVQIKTLDGALQAIGTSRMNTTGLRKNKKGLAAVTVKVFTS